MAIPVDEISAEARQVDMARVVLTVLAVPLYVAGWLAGKVFLALAWAGLAVKAGWRDARRRDESARAD
jgi:hypothetical protein